MIKKLTSILNSEKEEISIAEITRGSFVGQKVLVLTCEETGKEAPHLLDKQTIDWLKENLKDL